MFHYIISVVIVYIGKILHNVSRQVFTDSMHTDENGEVIFKKRVTIPVENDKVIYSIYLIYSIYI